MPSHYRTEMPLHSLDSLAFAELKEKNKLKQGLSNESAEHSKKTFTSLKSMAGGSKLVNTPLSMHSEMMAIKSALSVADRVVAGAVPSPNS
jgi:hypothetical protein